MSYYIVEVEEYDDINELKKHVRFVQSPKAIDDEFIVESDLTANELESIKGVVSAEPEQLDHLNDQFAYVQESFDSWFLPHLIQTQVLRSPRSGKNVDIYVMDTGMMIDHTDFFPRAQTIYTHDGKDYDPEDPMSPSHGTNVASCAGGYDYGPAKEANLLNVRYGFTSISGMRAFDAILDHHRNKDVDRVSILNMSYGSPSRIYRRIIQKLTDAGVICIAAAGNSGRLGVDYPAAIDDVIAVGSHDRSNKPSQFTNYGRDLDLYAPGEDGSMATVGEKHSIAHGVSGTSFSSPFVAGMCALLVEGSRIRTRVGVRKAHKRLLETTKRGLLTLDNQYKNDPNRIPTFEDIDKKPIIDI